MRCPNCNAWVGEEELFCGECGTRIARPEPAPAAPAVAEERGGAAAMLLGGGAAVVVAGVVVVVVICLCLAVVVVASGVLEPGPEPTFTQVARATNTPTLRAPTATPVRPTSTVRPTPTFRPSPTVPPVTPTATGGTFTDDFSDESGNWDLSSGTRGKSYIADGELHVELSQAQSIVWAVHLDDTWKDMVYEADSRQIAGPDANDYGLMFRYQDKQNFYRFVITGEGRYRVSKYVNGQWGTLVNWKSSPAINKGAAKNSLKVVCQGDTFELYVNDEKVDTVTDSDLDSGTIGVEAGSYDEAGVHVAFDNVRVRPAGVAFHDDFTDNRNSWSESEKAFFENGEYHLYDKDTGHTWWNSGAGIHGDLTVEVKIRKVEGPDNKSFGLVFRLLDGDNFYTFSISGDGSYRVFKLVDKKWVYITPWKKSEAIDKGNRTNVLRVVCKGQTFDVYINDEKVDSVQDDFLSQGKIGFHVSQDVHIAVDYVTVWAGE